MTQKAAAQGAKPTKGDPDAVYVKLELNQGDVATSQALGFVSKGLEHYRNAGKRLLKKKAELKHGEWLPWLEANGIDQPRASECIRLHKGWDKLPPGGSFGLKRALLILRGTEEAEGTSAGDTSDYGSAPDGGAQHEGQAGAGDEAAPDTSSKTKQHRDDKAGCLKIAGITPAEQEELEGKLSDLMAAWGLRSISDAAAGAIREAHARTCEKVRKGVRPCQK